jgi:thiamine biosynthesis lipoprotein
MKKILIITFAALAAFAWAYAWRGGYLRGDGRMLKSSRFLMDTLCTIQAPNALGRLKTEAAMARAFDRMAELDKKFNVVDPQSPVYKFNHDRTPITDPEVVALAAASLELSRLTDGAFDITVQPLVDLWGFFSTSASSHTVPSPAQVRAALAKTGWRRVLVADGRVTAADADVRLDFGSIAKGYIIGEGIKEMKAAGLESGLLLAGGQVQTYGTAAPGQPWKVGLRNPRQEGFIASLPFDTEMGVATAGDYERYFEVSGVRYHHIIDPGTGYPARGVMSVSVIAPDPVWADALDTALFVMGPRRALEFARRRGGLDVIVVDAAGKISTSRAGPAGNKQP